MLSRVVIVGAGQAAVQAAETLRHCGFKGSIVLVGDEPYLPYQRPPLSKKYLASQLERDRLFIRPGPHYAGRAVEVRSGRRAVEIERRTQRVRLDDGSDLAYDALLIATGSRPRVLPVPGADLAGVFYVRTIADVEAIRAACEPGRRLVIVGGGYVGLEVAATCRQIGLEVTVLEMADRVMKRVACAEVSRFIQAEHVRHGVRVLCDARVRGIAAHPGTRRVRSVQCEDAEHPAELIVIGVGVAPAQELAEAAGLTCSDGIVVDEHCRTSDENIYAAGDCTNQPHLRSGGRVRLESVDNAVEQATSAARNMLGEAVVHDKIPWFWSEQFDLKLITVGLIAGHDRMVMRGSMKSRSFSVCHLRDGELIAVESVNSPKDQMAARKLVGVGFRPDPQKLSDPASALRDCARHPSARFDGELRPRNTPSQ